MTDQKAIEAFGQGSRNLDKSSRNLTSKTLIENIFNEAVSQHMDAVSVSAGDNEKVHSSSSIFVTFPQHLTPGDLDRQRAQSVTSEQVKQGAQSLVTLPKMMQLSPTSDQKGLRSGIRDSKP